MSSKRWSYNRKRVTTPPVPFAVRVLSGCGDKIPVARPLVRETVAYDDALAYVTSELGAGHQLARSIVEHPERAALALIDVVLRPESTASEMRVARAAFQRLGDRNGLLALFELFPRYASESGEQCHALVYMAAAFGERVVEPALALAARHPELRGVLVETFALARAADERAFALAYALLDEEPAHAALFLAEWGDPRSIDALRARLAGLDVTSATDWEAAWEITDALLVLGATLTPSEQNTRRNAFAHQEELSGPGERSTLGQCADVLGRAPLRAARVLADIGGDDAVGLLRAGLTHLDQQWYSPHHRWLNGDGLWPHAPGSAHVALALLDALTAAGASPTDIEVSIGAHARAAIDAGAGDAAYGKRPRSEAELEDEQRAKDEAERAEKERKAEAARRPSFSAEFDAAFLTLDEQVIRKVLAKWGLVGELPQEPAAFWSSVHGVRAAIRTLPYEARKLSREWLIAHGIRPPIDPDFPRETAGEG